MDPLTDLLAGPRARDAFVLRTVLEPPWAIEVRDRAPLTLVAVLRGSADFALGDDRARLGTGDVLLVQSCASYLLGDVQGSPPATVIHPGGRCQDLAGRPVHESMSHGLRTWGNDPHGREQLVIGTYGSVGAVGELLTAALPPWLVVRAEEHPSASLDLMSAEIARDAPGQGTLLDRLLDVLLIETVRAHAAIVARSAEGCGSWLTATDPVVVEALRLLHSGAGRSWTLESLALAARTSRATLSRRFLAQVGEPPMAYLTRCRLARAADLLTQEGATVAAAARAVGYSTPFALSAAFKRHYGLSPRDYRALLDGGPGPPRRKPLVVPV